MPTTSPQYNSTGTRITEFELLEARDLAILLARSVTAVQINSVGLRRANLNILEVDATMRGCFRRIALLSDKLCEKLADTLVTTIERAVAKYQLHSILARYGKVETTWHGMAKALGRCFLMLTIWPEEPLIELPWERELYKSEPGMPLSEDNLRRYYAAFWGRIRAFHSVPDEMVSGLRLEYAYAVLEAPKEAMETTSQSGNLGLTVSDAARLFCNDVSGLDMKRAMARVSWAATNNRFRTNGKKGRARRIDPDSFSSYRLQQRERELDLSDRDV